MDFDENDPFAGLPVKLNVSIIRYVREGELPAAVTCRCGGD